MPTLNKPNILDFMAATGNEVDQSVNEVSLKYVLIGREWTSKVAAQGPDDFDGDSISLSQYEKNIVLSLSEECARLEVEAMSLMARPNGDDDVFAEDDVENDDLSCYAEEEALAAIETSLCEELSFVSYEDLPVGIYESDVEESSTDDTCTIDEKFSSLSVLTSSISMLGRSLKAILSGLHIKFVVLVTTLNALG